MCKGKMADFNLKKLKYTLYRSQKMIIRKLLKKTVKQKKR